MRRAFVIASVVAGSVGLTGLVRTGEARSPRSREIERLQNHFDSVAVELNRRDIASLTTTQRAKRATLASWLREYRNAGVFPTNDRFDTSTPFFRDSKGVLCAMAYLIDRSGRADIVAKVAASRNNAHIAQLADDPTLIAWLDSAGLSVAEAARIQPTYGGFPDEPPADRDGVRSNVALAAVGFGGTSLAATTLNVVKPSYLSGFLGIIAGGASVITGANYRDENRETDRVATTMIALGAVSLGSGVYGILAARNDNERDHERHHDGRRRRMSLQVSPDVTIRDRAPQLGLLAHASF